LNAQIIDAREQSWPLDKPFRTARGASTETRVVVVTVTDGQHTGRGEAVPITRYQQNTALALARIESIKGTRNLNRKTLQELLPPSAARNALDCALWDLESKIEGTRVWELAKIPITEKVQTTVTISLDSPEAMAAAAKTNASLPLLKLKLGGDDLDVPRVQAVREAAPSVRLLIDANESWTPSHYRKVVPALRELGIELIEQPFPASGDEVLKTLEHPIPICADESCHTSDDVSSLANRYEMLNVKLDKTGGLTEGLRLVESARQSGFKLLVGCMVCTSLGIAPARILASITDYADLDGPLLLAGDRHHGLNYDNGTIAIPNRLLWG